MSFAMTRLRALAHACSYLVSASSIAAANGPPLILHPEPVSFPSMGRVILGFVVTVGVAVGIAYGVRRWLPRLTKNLGSDVPSRLISEAFVRNGTRFHIVTVDGETVLLAECKTGVAMTILPKKIETPSLRGHE